MKTEEIYELLKQASEAYYSGNDLILSDEQYDKLSEMYEYETVGAKTSENTSKHMYRMYSLQKYFVGEKALSELFSGKKDTIIDTPKLDGAAIAVYFSNGKLSLALTRGDGEIGQDITDKAQNIEGLPWWVPFANPFVQVCGEVVVKKEVPNARNYASGALNLKNVDELKERHQLYFFAYSVYPFITESYKEDIETLGLYGFTTVFSKKLDAFRHDGRVLRVDSNNLFNSLGFTNHHPRGSLAVKERKAGVPTKLRDVIWQVGKSGRVTPVAILDPVDIEGATIRKATLNNAGFIRAMNLHIGDTVEVVRSGDIIPTIIGKWQDA